MSILMLNYFRIFKFINLLFILKPIYFKLEFYIQIMYVLFAGSSVHFGSKQSVLSTFHSSSLSRTVACRTVCLLLLSDSQNYLAWYPLNSISHLKALHPHLSGLISSGMFWNFFADKLSSRNSCIFNSTTIILKCALVRKIFLQLPQGFIIKMIQKLLSLKCLKISFDIVVFSM